MSGSAAAGTAVTVVVAGAILIAIAVRADADVGAERPEGASPICGVTVPVGYRDWRLVAPALESAPLDELRAVVGNDTAVGAYRADRLPFPDGSVLVKLAWKRVPSTEYPPAAVPGAPTTVQVMVKHSTRWPQTGGWGFGRFVDGRPVDAAQHETCFACHKAGVMDHDFVFTRYAP